MSKREIHLLLDGILTAAQKILSYTDGISFEDFLKDERTIDAVVRNFEIIGEAGSSRKIGTSCCGFWSPYHINRPCCKVKASKSGE
jgi:Protein of unknown function DUF86